MLRHHAISGGVSCTQSDMCGVEIGIGVGEMGLGTPSLVIDGKWGGKKWGIRKMRDGDFRAKRRNLSGSKENELSIRKMRENKKHLKAKRRNLSGDLIRCPS